MTVDIDQLTEHLPADQAREVKRAYRKRAKDETAAFLWCFFLGGVGAHRFYLRQWTRALLHLQVLVIAALVVIAGIIVDLPPLLIVAFVAPFILGALIWTFVDLAHIDDEVSERNLLLAERLASAAMLADPARERQAEAQLEAAQRQAAATDVAAPPAPEAPFAPERESPPPLDVGVQAMTGIAGLGIAGGYRVVAEPAHDAGATAAPTAPVAEPYAEPATEPYVAPPAASAWDASTPAWDTPTPPSRTIPDAPVPTTAPPARDLTDLGGDLGSVPPIADIEPGGPWLLHASAAETGAEDVGLLVLEPEPEPAYAPPVWPAAPAEPVQPPEWPLPADAQPPAPTPSDAGDITPGMVADAAGLAGAGGIGAMGVLAGERSAEAGQTAPPESAPPAPPESAPPAPPESAPPAPPHLLRHIRVVRQVTVGDTV
jgi:TM2 domain-containing membrane protein YozV